MILKSFDEMDASHKLAYKMGMDEAARRVANPDYEAAAEQICSKYGSWEPEVVEFYTNIAKSAVNAALGITTEDTE